MRTHATHRIPVYPQVLAETTGDGNTENSPKATKHFAMNKHSLNCRFARYQSPKKAFMFFCLAMCFGLLNAQNSKPVKGIPNTEAINAALKESRNKIWMQENIGQLPSNVQYAFITSFGAMYVENDHIRLVAIKDKPQDFLSTAGFETENSKVQRELHAVNIWFTGGSTKLKTAAKERQVTEINYIKGTNPSNWTSNVPVYGEVVLENVYEGINLRLYSDADGTLEFDWILTSAADLSKIKMRVEGQDKLTMLPSGGFSLGLRMANIDFKLPESYQIIGGKKVPASVRYRLQGANELVFEAIGITDIHAPLVVDPTVLWGTWFDGNNTGFDAYSYAVEVDSCGNTYVANTMNLDVTSGSNYGSSIPSGGYDLVYNSSGAGIYKLNANATSIVNFTYVDENDILVDLGIFPNGDVIAVGYVGTNNTTFPMVNAYSSNTSATAVAIVFNASLSTVKYSTRLPGRVAQGNLSITGGSNSSIGATSVQVVNNNDYYIGGITNYRLSGFINSTAVDTSLGGAEAYIARFNGSNYNNKVWATYVGGDNNEEFISIKMDMGKSLLCFGGYTNSSSSAGFPATTAGVVDNTWSGTSEGWVGTILHSTSIPTSFQMLTYLGGSSGEDRGVLDCDSNYIYILNMTNSNDFPGTSVSGVYNGSYSLNGSGSDWDMVITRLPFSGTTGFRSTYLGGGSDEYSGGLIYNSQDYNLYFFGTSNDAGSSAQQFPTINSSPASNFYDNSHGGNLDIVIGSINCSLTSLRYSSFIGGSENDYLGNTGVLKGAGHYSFNHSADIYALTTTVHSNVSGTSGTSNELISGSVFDATRTPSVSTSADAQIVIKMNLSSADLGDVPAGYEQGNPAQHRFNPRILTTPRLGLLIDADLRNQPNVLASGDDDNITSADPCSVSGDDEDGIAAFPTLTVDDPISGPTSYTVPLSVFNNSGSVARVYAWIDFDDSGNFETTEYATTTVNSSSSQQSVNLVWNLTGKTCPVTITGGRTYARVRITTTTLSDLSATTYDDRAIGVANDGEVEDYYVNIRGRDYGDLPTSYGIASSIRYGDFNDDNIPDDPGAVWLGSLVDIEKDCSPKTSANAMGDDNDQVDDDDGVVFPSGTIRSSAAYTFQLLLGRSTPGSVVYYGVWIDWNADGDFTDPGDGFFSGNSTASSVNINIVTPGTSGFNPNFALRARVSGSALIQSNYNGALGNGEVEDYINVQNPNIRGIVYDDANGITNLLVDGTPLNTVNGLNLYAYLVNQTGFIVDSARVRSDGTFLLANAAYSSSYNTILSTDKLTIGTNPVINTSLAGNWVYVGENFGLSNNAGLGLTPGTPDGNIATNIGSSLDITNVLFGLDLKPIAYSKSYQVSPDSVRSTGNSNYPIAFQLNNASGNSNTAVNSTSPLVLPGILSGDDGEEGILNGVTGTNATNVVYFENLPDPNNAVLAYFNGVANIFLVPSPTIADPSFVYWSVARSRYEIPNFNKTRLGLYFKYAFQSSTQFDYGYYDLAGVAGPTANYLITFSTPLPILNPLLSCNTTVKGTQLEWYVSDFGAFNNFIVYGKTNSDPWITIGNVPAFKNGIPQNKMDVNTKEVNKMYYQIAGITKDSVLYKSNICQINTNMAQNNEYLLVPNPTTSTAYLVWKDGNAETARVNISDQVGKLLSNFTVNVSGNTPVDLDLTKWPAGIYNIQVVSGEVHKTFKLVKLN